MAVPSLDFLDRISNFIARVGKVLAMVGSFLMYAVASWAGVFKEAYAYIAEKLTAFSSGHLGDIQSADFSSIDMIAYVNGVFPVTELIGLLTVYSGAWILLILIRWTKSFIPTIGN